MNINPQKTNAYIFLGVIVLFVLYVVSQYISIRLVYKPMFDWWNNNNGKQYNDKLKILNLVSAKANPIIFYISNSLFTPPLAQNSRGGIQFVLSALMPNALLVDENSTQIGVITPRSLCESVLPDPTLDKKYSEWIKKGTRGGIQVDPDCDTKLTYTVISTTNNPKGGSSTGWYAGVTLNVYQLDTSSTDKNTGKVRIWPDRDDTIGWAGLIFEWLNGPESTKNGNWDDKDGTPTCPNSSDKNAPMWYTGVDDKGNLEIMQNLDSHKWGGKNTPDYFKFWFNLDTNTGFSNPPGDNWISRMGIRATSILIAGFINDKYTLGGVTVDHKAFENLLGTEGDIAGGWMGFIHGNPASSDEYDNMIHTANEWNPPPRPPSCNHPSLGQSFLSGLVAFAGVVAMVALPGASAALEPLLIAGTCSGVISGVQSATSCS